MSLMTTANLQKTWAQDMDKLRFNQFKLVPAQSPDIFNEETITNMHYVRRGALVGLASLQSMNEGNAIPFDSLLDGPEKTVYPAKFGLQVQVTNEAMQDDRSGILKNQLGTSLGIAQKQTIEFATWDILNSGFATTRVGVDGKALFASDHPLYGVPGATFSNIATGSLSRSTLQSAIKIFHTLVNDRNLPIMYEPAVLVIHPNLEWKAKELLMSPYDPETANRNINPIYGIGLRYYVSRYVTSTTAWYLISEKALHDMRILWFTKPQFNSYPDENVEAMIFKASMRFLSTFWDWRGVVASMGV
jgi:hypothetical protein